MRTIVDDDLQDSDLALLRIRERLRELIGDLRTVVSEQKNR